MGDIYFTKISATGNDFIIIDNRQGRFHAQRDRQFFSRLCQRRISVGADGVILIEPSSVANFKYIHINSDGSIAEMCGNGSRAVAYYAHGKGIAPQTMSFEISSHVYHAQVDHAYVTTDFIAPTPPRFDLDIITESDIKEGGFIDSGVPHLVLFVNNVDEVNVNELGRKYRQHPAFPKGTNVDFVEVVNLNSLRVRTYERGVEEETLACGTGAVACSIIAHIRNNVKPPLQIYFRGGVLKVNFDDKFHNVTLAGLVEPVYEGKLIMVA